MVTAQTWQLTHPVASMVRAAPATSPQSICARGVPARLLKCRDAIVCSMTIHMPIRLHAYEHCGFWTGDESIR